MGAWKKLKLLFKIRKPASQVVSTVAEAGNKDRGWKTLSFWVTLLGSLAATGTALTGVIPPPAQLVAVTVLTAFYNILRGLQKADSPEIKGTLRTTEFWLSALGEGQKALVAFQMGGIHPNWMASATATVGALLAAGQNLSARQVTNELPATDAPKKKS